jgi:N-terminal domain of NWD NACHT-NTPase
MAPQTIFSKVKKFVLRQPKPAREASTASHPSSNEPPGLPRSVDTIQATANSVDEDGDKVVSSISELWDEAYDLLGQDDNTSGLITDYEKVLSEALGINNVATQRGQRRQQMETLVKIKTEELENGTWKVGFSGHKFAVKDFVEPVVSVVEWGKEYIGSAVEPSPPASIAWAGVCLLLPVSLDSILIRSRATKNTLAIAQPLARRKSPRGRHR